MGNDKSFLKSVMQYKFELAYEKRGLIEMIIFRGAQHV